MVIAARSDSVAGRKWEVRFLLGLMGLGRMGCCCWSDGGGEVFFGGGRDVVGEMKKRRVSGSMLSIMAFLSLSRGWLRLKLG